MATLNESFDSHNVPNDVRATFIGGQFERRLLLANHEFYKFTQHPLVPPNGRVTPWWSSVTPLDPDDPGLAGTLERAARLGVSGADFSRARSAVTKQWNSMSGLLIARLIVPAYGFVGRCSHQRYDDDPAFANVLWIGGAWQVWIPNLSSATMVKV
jgi:hypothetical protein